MPELRRKNGGRRMTLDEEQLEIFGGEHTDFINMAIRALGMQKKLAAFRGMDICEWAEDYDYDENNTSEYEFEASVEDFLIDEAKEEVDKNDD